jgi:branched-subunit amino acid aminotransferase/4-amino-4-deoxychorismate lyase
MLTLYDGQFFDAAAPILTADMCDRVFLRTALRVNRTKLMFWDENIEQMAKILCDFGADIPPFLLRDGAELKRQIRRALIRNRLYRSTMVVIRLLHDDDRRICYMLHMTAFDTEEYAWHENGLYVEPDFNIRHLPCPLLPDRLPRKLYIDNADNISNVSSCNVYIIVGEEVIMLAPSCGAIADPANQTVVEAIAAAGMTPVEVSELPLASLTTADEMFLAGHLYGIQWVKSFAGRHYLNRQTRRIATAFNSAVINKGTEM